MPNLTLLLVPLCIALVCTLITFQSARENTLEQSENISKQIQSQIDNILVSTRNSGFALMQDRYIKYASTVADPIADPYVQPELIAD